MWPRVINIIIGLWLTVAPGVLAFNKSGANNAHILGPLIITCSTTAIWQCTRGMRFCNLPIGCWLLMAPFILDYTSRAAAANDVTSGFLLIIFALIRGKMNKEFGGGWSALWSSDSNHVQQANNK